MKITLGISSCLLGARVRYDGELKLDSYLSNTLGSYVEYVPLCPEVEAGLPVPREPMRLQGDPQAPHLITIHTQRNLTVQLDQWARMKIQALRRQDLYGFIFKSKSPSCGTAHVNVYDQHGQPHRVGRGLFVQHILQHFPLLPVEEECGLHDPDRRERFIERIFASRRWRQLLRQQGLKQLIEFHTNHKLLLLSHSPSHYRAMGQLLARAKELAAAVLLGRYQALFFEALQVKGTKAKQVKVMQHILGTFKKQLTPNEKREALELIQGYREGLLPRIVPLTLLNHFVRQYHHPYLTRQVYLQPHPLELLLRNHA